MTWEIKCDVCGRSSLDGKADDGAGDRCSACGQFPALESFTCPVCRMTSYNPNDVEHGYCGNCHAFTAHRDKHRLRIGGVMRCCAQTLGFRVDEEEPPEEGEKLPCRWCPSGLVYRDGAWEWDREIDEGATR